MGVTATIPDVVPPLLPYSEPGPPYWNYVYSSIWHNGKRLYSGLHNLVDSSHISVGFMLTAEGDLYVSSRKVAHDLAVNNPLWGAVDVQGECKKIKSEVLKGTITTVH